MEIDNLTLTDLIEADELRAIRESFAAATGMAVCVLDKNEAVPADSKWCCRKEFCENCAKHSSEGADRCKKFFQKSVEEAKRSALPYIGTCHAGVTEFAVPIIIRGTYVGAMVGGQVFTNRPDDRKMTSSAHILGIDAAKYISLANAVETMPEQRVEAAANLISKMISDMAESGYTRAVSAKRGAMARDNFGGETGSDSEIKRKISVAVDMIDEAKRGCESIKNAVAASTKDVDNTDSIVKTIENASTQLTLIGFNASIEAKRAGAAGAGFNVIAQEVRTLAERNTKQVGEIENTLDGIKKDMGNINNKIRILFGDIENIADSMNELSCAAAEAETQE
ncbi:MAG: PocR ligand-binding domain-containing protein [Oscillospiraceae bacterium]|nr:PocR ligand-binding domain-containing protein [Oscillospiraceae bacterium]